MSGFIQRRDHAKPIVVEITLAIFKRKGIGTGLHMDFASDIENRFEANALFANIPLNARFGALTNRTDCFDVSLGKPIFIRVDDNSALFESKGQRR